MADVPEFLIRKADADDIPVLIQFVMQEALEAEGRTLDPKHVSRGVSQPFQNEDLAHYWVVVESAADPALARVIGTASAVPEWSDWEGARYWWIQSMFLLSEYRGRGIMNQLLSEMESEARRQGVLELRLYVHENNLAAARAYEKVQFQDTPYRMMSKKLFR